MHGCRLISYLSADWCRFRAIKAAESAKKAEAMKAAEEASRKAAAEAEVKLQQLREQQERQKVSVGAELEEVEGHEMGEGSNGVPDVAPSKVRGHNDTQLFYFRCLCSLARTLGTRKM